VRHWFTFQAHPDVKNAALAFARQTRDWQSTLLTLDYLAERYGCNTLRPYLNDPALLADPDPPRLLAELLSAEARGPEANPLS
jgi:hypothetical protein